MRFASDLKKMLPPSALHARDGGFPAGIDPVKPWQRREMQLYPWVGIFAADAERLQTEVNVAADLY